MGKNIHKDQTMPVNSGRIWMLLFAGLLLGCFSVLGYRLIDLQIRRHDQLRGSALDNSIETIQLPSRRGNILDANGYKLATSKFVKTIAVDPTRIGKHYPEVADILAPLLGMDKAKLERKLKPTFRKNINGEILKKKNGDFVYDKHVRLKRKVLPEVWEEIEKAMAQIELRGVPVKLTQKQRLFYHVLRSKAVYAEATEEQVRVYPARQLAAHVLGYVNAEHVGKEGIERILNTHLTGALGWRTIEHDRGGTEHVERRVQNVPPRNGLDAVLTIDSAIQSIVEEELVRAMRGMKSKAITAIVIDPRTGDVLAMANLPTYDPNMPGNDANVRRNRAVTDLAEPGSTFKAITVAAALNENEVKLHHKFHCSNGRFLYGGRALHDHHSYGTLTVEEIITKSSNIGAAKIALKLGSEKLHKYITDFGFGKRTGILLLGERNGLVYPVKRWGKLAITRIPMGYGVMVTPLQTVMMMSAIANGGQLMEPRILSKLQDGEGRVVAEYLPKPVRQVVSRKTAEEITVALKTVVAPGGTARRAQLSHYTVAGKTGTAEKVIEGHYSKDLHYSSFVGFFPTDEPQLCIMVAVDEPPKGMHYGGTAAGPVFKEIAEKTASYLGITPDKVGRKVADSGGR